MGRYQRIIEKLTDGLQPTQLDVRDESHRHAGHAGVAPGALETHMVVRVASPIFSGLSRLECHRFINHLLADEFTSGLHALRIEIVV